MIGSDRPATAVVVVEAAAEDRRPSHPLVTGFPMLAALSRLPESCCRCRRCCGGPTDSSIGRARSSCGRSTDRDIRSPRPPLLRNGFDDDVALAGPLGAAPSSRVSPPLSAEPASSKAKLLPNGFDDDAALAGPAPSRVFPTPLSSDLASSKAKSTSTGVGEDRPFAPEPFTPACTLCCCCWPPPPILRPVPPGLAPAPTIPASSQLSKNAILPRSAAVEFPAEEASGHLESGDLGAGELARPGSDIAQSLCCDAPGAADGAELKLFQYAASLLLPPQLPPPPSSNPSINTSCVSGDPGARGLGAIGLRAVGVRRGGVSVLFALPPTPLPPHMLPVAC